MAKVRVSRLAEEIKKEVSIIIRNDIKDPKIQGLVSITAVEVSGDMRHAKIFISCLGNDEDKKDVIAGFNRANKFIRGEVAKKLNLRYTPEFTFEIDDSLEKGAYINKLLHDLNKE